MNSVILKFKRVDPRSLLAILCLVNLGAALSTFKDYGINPDEGSHISWDEVRRRWGT